MTLAAFTRLTERALAHLGESARLRDEVLDPPILVNVEHGVDVTGLYGEVVVSKSVATIDKKYAPQVDDKLDMLEKQPDDTWAVVQSYVLDVVLNDNGYSTRYVLREA